ncbi:MAG TPA: hypothetical protein VF608_01830, partial [Thermoanaerobaculia bacterium]
NSGVGSDIAQSGSQPYVREANDDRSFESSSGNRSDWQSNNTGTSSSSREERSDNSSDGGPLSNRDRI